MVSKKSREKHRERFFRHPVSGQGFKQPNQYVLAFRGTEIEAQGGLDLKIDATDIALDGLAMDQIVDMYNYWIQLNATQGAGYSVAVLEKDDALTVAYNAAKLAGPAVFLVFKESLNLRTDIVIDEPLGNIRTIHWKSSTEVFSDERSLGLGIAPAQVTVVGHSLGGHLAAAFSRLFASSTKDVLMINGAGFSDQGAIATIGNGPSNIAHLFGMLNGESSFNQDKITNLIGSANSDFVAQDWWIGLNQPGNFLHVITESLLSSAAYGHGSAQMSDSMAVYDLFFRLDKFLTNTPINDAIAFLEPIFKSASSDTYSTLESLLTILGKVLVNNYKPLGTADKDNREKLYDHINQIKNALPSTGTVILPLVNKPVDTIIANAKDNGTNSLAYRYALKEFIPFILDNVDYSRFNKNGELDLYNPTTDKGSLSEAWITDRAKMFSWVMLANTNDNNSPYVYPTNNTPSSWSSGDSIFN